jgi:hypothetical protein
MTNFKIQLRRRNVPDDELLADIKNCAEVLTKNSITAVEYTKNGAFGVNTILRRFKSWNAALEIAGLVAPNRQNIPDSELFENLANVWISIGHQPFGREMDKSNGVSVIALGTYEKRFGSWNNALMAFDQYINNGIISDSKSEIKPSATPQAKKRTTRKVNWRLRAQVLIRDNCICQMCGASPAKNPSITLHADHVKPWAKGGETVLENLQTLCHVCNIGKSDMHDGTEK